MDLDYFYTTTKLKTSIISKNFYKCCHMPNMNTS